ncbi:MAG: hypothetical protein HY842_05135 [Bacteroidetes bacterium]|nr:hypothetical protein [Bacteroidota bacterium]
MDWKKKFTYFEDKKDWDSLMIFIQEIIKKYSENVEVSVRVIYMLHNLLVEEDCNEVKADYYTKLLLKHFNDAQVKFINDAEYLFFIGKILYISEWYFGINDDLKPINERLAFRMQAKAFEIENNNPLFEWAYLFTLHDVRATSLARQILYQEKFSMKWLKTKGFPGKYIIECLERNAEPAGAGSSR